MTLTDYLLDPSDWGTLSSDWGRPLALIDLAKGHVFNDLPPLPVIGLGDRNDPHARALDAVIEAPVSANGLIEQITANPQSAAVTVQLLRAIDGMPAESALLVESLAYGLLQGGAEHARWLARQERPAQTASPGRLALERQGDVLDVLIDRPEALGAIDRTLRDGLFDAFTLAAIDPEIRQVRLRSVGPAFSVGADLSEFGTTRDPATAHMIRGRTLPAHPLSRCADKVEAHIKGACVGAGLEMAAFCGRVTAEPNAWFQLPELAMGLLPGAGGCVSVSRRIGRQRAALMMLSGKRIGARVALAWGLIDAIAGDEGSADLGG